MDERGIFAALVAPFDAREVKSREVKGRRISYVTARTVQNRLDEVLGPAGWWAEYRPFGERGVVCRLTIDLGDGRTLTKEDVGGISITADESDCEKSGFSDAFKRAASVIGVGRYLYGDGTPRAAAAEGRRDPEPAGPPAVAGRVEAPRGDAREPTDGRGLYGWLKDEDAWRGSDVLAAVQSWGLDRGFPARMVAWDGLQAAEGLREARRLFDGFDDAASGSERRRLNQSPEAYRDRQRRARSLRPTAAR